MHDRAFKRLLVGLSAAAIAGVTSTSAAAQTMTPATLGTASLAKSEAILGGSRSMLAEVLAQQQGISLETSAPLQPATLRRTVAPLQSLADAPLPESPAVTSGRPDVFGSVALAVQRTPLDRRWRKVERARLGGSPAAFARSLEDRDAIKRIDAVNRYVNHRVRFVDDSRQYGHADRWTTAADTLRRGRGDCEDYAIAKLQMLRAAGLSDRDLYLVVVKDLVRRADHAVLVVRAGGRMLMLDNGTDRIADTENVRDYRPVLTFAADGAWTHGYRRASPPLRIAAADLKDVAPAADRRSAD